MGIYFDVLKKYATFSGRARRKEYWVFALINFIIAFMLSLIDSVISPELRLLSTLFSLFILIPGFAVMARRLHDIGKSGWWILIGFVPLIGIIVLLVFACLDSQPGDNQYGPNPKQFSQ